MDTVGDVKKLIQSSLLSNEEKDFLLKKLSEIGINDEFYTIFNKLLLKETDTQATTSITSEDILAENYKTLEDFYKEKVHALEQELERTISNIPNENTEKRKMLFDTHNNMLLKLYEDKELERQNISTETIAPLFEKTYEN